jgi:hypothetical protein
MLLAGVEAGAKILGVASGPSAHAARAAIAKKHKAGREITRIAFAPCSRFLSFICFRVRLLGMLLRLSRILGRERRWPGDARHVAHSLLARFLCADRIGISIPSEKQSYSNGRSRSPA